MTEEIRDKVRLKCGRSTIELQMDQIEQFIMAPEVIRIPCAPDEIKGLMEYGDRLIVLCGSGADCENDERVPACAAVVRREDGEVYGILADEIVGGIV